MRDRPPRDPGVDDRWTPRGQSRSKARLELLEGVDGVAVGTAGLSVGGVVGVLELDQAGLLVRGDLDRS